MKPRSVHHRFFAQLRATLLALDPAAPDAVDQIRLVCIALLNHLHAVETEAEHRWRTREDA